MFYFVPEDWYKLCYNGFKGIPGGRLPGRHPKALRDPRVDRIQPVWGGGIRAVWSRLPSPAGEYCAEPLGITIGGVLVTPKPKEFGVTLIDSGTTLTLLPHVVMRPGSANYGHPPLHGKLPSTPYPR